MEAENVGLGGEFRKVDFTLGKSLTSQQPKMGLGVRGDGGSRERNKGKEEGRKSEPAGKQKDNWTFPCLISLQSHTHTHHFS